MANVLRGKKGPRPVIGRTVGCLAVVSIKMMFFSHAGFTGDGLGFSWPRLVLGTSTSSVRFSLDPCIVQLTLSSAGRYGGLHGGNKPGEWRNGEKLGFVF